MNYPFHSETGGGLENEDCNSHLIVAIMLSFNFNSTKCGTNAPGNKVRIKN